MGLRRGPAATSAPAFTLLEILIVLGILILLASIAWPAMESQIKAAEMPESADRIRSMLFMARCEAVMEHRRHRIRFDPEHQQPFIEIESDPIRRPGEFDTITSGWAVEPMVLGDVQVHEVRLGRPVWTMSLATTDDPDEAEEQADPGFEQESEDEEREREAFLNNIAGDEDIEVDENRLMIVFEADGSSGWATLVLARIDPEDELEEEEPQLWVVLDGRTGLATVRKNVTEEQLADSDFFVDRQKLEPPDLLGLGGLGFDISSDSFGIAGAAGAAGDAGGGGSAGEDPFADLLGDYFEDPGEPGAESSFATGAAGTGAAETGATRTTRRASGQEEARQDSLSELEEKLSGSDYTEEEKEKIRKWYREES